MLLKTMLYTTAIAATALPALATPAVHGAVVPDAPSSAVHPEKWPEVAYPQVLPARGEAHVRALLARMSVEQKGGPTIKADIGSVTPKAVSTGERRVGNGCIGRGIQRWVTGH